MDKIKISVIIPYRNVEKYLEQCLDSVINQTLEDIEIICVNDASSDKSPEIVKEYIAKDARIKNINLEIKKGQAFARNRGMETAEGEYICFIDSDDWADSYMLEKLYTKAKETDSDIVMCGANLYDDVTKETDYHNSYYSLEELNNKTENVFFHNDVSSLLTGINVSLWAKLYKREFLQKSDIKIPEGYIYEDLPYFYNSFLKAKRVSLVKENLYFYRINRINSTMQDIGKSVLDRIPMVQLAYEYLSQTDYFNLIKTGIIGWIINDVFHRYTLVRNLYQKEFYFQMKSLFLSLDLEGVDIDSLKTFYCYNEFELIKKKSYDECNKIMFATYKDSKKMVKEIEAQRDIELKRLSEEQIQTYNEMVALREHYESELDHVRFILKVVKKIKKIKNSVLRYFGKK